MKKKSNSYNLGNIYISKSSIFCLKKSKIFASYLDFSDINIKNDEE